GLALGCRRYLEHAGRGRDDLVLDGQAAGREYEAAGDLGDLGPADQLVAGLGAGDQVDAELHGGADARVTHRLAGIASEGDVEHRNQKTAAGNAEGVGMLRAEQQLDRRGRRLAVDVERPVAMDESARITENLEAVR